MRPDMFKVIIESGRSGGFATKDVTTPRRKDDWDAYLSVQGMRLPYGQETKEQTDRFSVMRRYMASQVGRLWDDVWSEVCANISGRHVLGFHLRGHLGRDVVTRHVMMRKGVPHEPSPWSPGGWRALSPGDLYVHPETRRICWWRKGEARRLRWKPKVDPNVRQVSPTRTLKYERGVWYQYDVRPLPVGVEGPLPYDKKQLNKKELKHYNLR